MEDMAETMWTFRRTENIPTDKKSKTSLQVLCVPSVIDARPPLPIVRDWCWTPLPITKVLMLDSYLLHLIKQLLENLE